MSDARAFPQAYLKFTEAYKPTPSPATPSPATPSPVTPSPVDTFQLEIIFKEGFEAGFGEFQDGGRDAVINKNRKHDGQKVLRILDNFGSSKAYANDYDVVSYSKLRVHFFYFVLDMDNG